VDEQERIKKNRKRARNWALVIGAIAVAFYVGIFFLIHARY
jgi:hypothetical protein